MFIQTNEINPNPSNTLFTNKWSAIIAEKISRVITNFIDINHYEVFYNVLNRLELNQVLSSMISNTIHVQDVEARIHRLYDINGKLTLDSFTILSRQYKVLGHFTPLQITTDNLSLDEIKF